MSVKNTKLLSVGVKYPMRDPICNAINYSASSFNLGKLVIKNLKKRQMEIKEIFTRISV